MARRPAERRELPEAYAVLHGYGGMPRAEAGALFKLTAEMLHIPVTAEFGYGYNRFFRI